MPAEVTLSAFVRAGANDQPYVEQCAAAAEIMVSRLIGDATVSEVTREQAVLLTGANLYQRRATVTEMSQYQNGLTQPVPSRPTLDPLNAARQVLAAELGPGIA